MTRGARIARVLENLAVPVRPRLCGPSTPRFPAPGVRFGTGMLVSDPTGSDDPSVPCHPVLPARFVADPDFATAARRPVPAGVLTGRR